jgi:hypothetical protein
VACTTANSLYRAQYPAMIGSMPSQQRSGKMFKRLSTAGLILVLGSAMSPATADQTTNYAGTCKRAVSFSKTARSTEDLRAQAPVPIDCIAAALLTLREGRRSLLFVGPEKNVLFTGSKIVKHAESDTLIMELDLVVDQNMQSKTEKPRALLGATGYCLFDSTSFEEAKYIRCFAKYEKSDIQLFYRIDFNVTSVQLNTFL